VIRIYPSRHEINLYPSHQGMALESHVIATPVTIADWMRATIVKGEDGKPVDLSADVQPVSFDVNGQTIPASAWEVTRISPDDDVRIYPVPFGIEIGVVGWIAIAFAAVAVVYALTLSTPGAPESSSAQGDQLNLNPAKANGVKLYQPIREVLGRAKVYPDYALQPITRFITGRDVRTSLFLVVGAGRYVIPPSQIRIGETPISAFGSDVQYTIYEPGANVAGDPRSENWYSAPEVGASKSATAGLDLDSPDRGSSPIADAIALTGNTITVVGESAELPSAWVNGTIINLIAPDNFLVSSSTTHSVIAGPLDELEPFVGMEVTLTILSEGIDLVVASYSPYVAPVPGVGGSPSSITASAAPTTYDFSGTPIAWNLTYKSVTRSLSLTADYVNMSGVMAEITSQLSGMGLVAQDDSGRLKIVEPSSPYSGGAISMSSAPIAIFGAGPVYEVGTASTGGTPEQLANITLKYPDNTPFIGIPDGLQRLAIGYRQNRYRINSKTGLTIAVTRLKADGTNDTGWGGFTGRSLLDFSLSSSEVDSENWIGPFVVCPEGEVVDRIEWDVFFPGGLYSFTSKGDERPHTSRVVFEYADITTGTWVTISKDYTRQTKDAFGRTEFVDLPTPIRPIARIRRAYFGGRKNNTEATQWYALRGRLLSRPTSYPGVTCLAMTVRTGSRLSAQSDRQVSVVATRIYEDGESRSISGALEHVCQSLPGGAEFDADEIAQLQADYWTPRGETFDHAFDEQVTAKEALQTILNAGMSFLAIEDSKVTAIREGVKPITGAITPHEQAAELKTSFTSPSADDFSGVDVKYIDPVTFAAETVECRLPGLDPLKIESYTLDGVQSRTRAWRIGMRRLMKYQTQRLTHQTETELSALAYRMLDHVVMTDDIPGNQTISSIIESLEVIDSGEFAGMTLITSSEELDWSFDSPRVLLKYQDGSVSQLLTPTRVGDDQVLVSTALIETDVDWSIEPPRMVFCSSTKVGYSAMIESVEPDQDGRCSVIAKQYSDIFYQYDDSAPA
jgi:hypothetical protein